MTDTTPTTQPAATIGVVAIGRNEGQRLVVCLRAALASGGPVVYVDSGSTDGSVATAREMGAHVVELDVAQPFTAARARNAGLAELLRLNPGLRYVQFVDGDCELQPGWLAAAAGRLGARGDLAVVCGRRRERFPDASLFNKLCDMEWDTPVGEARACGGDAMMRVEALRAVGGFRDDLICGEEPELCVRLRQAGWAVERLAQEMTLHDAAMSRWSQWGQRTRRAGVAAAPARALHGRSPLRHGVKQTRTTWVWTLGLVAAAGLLGVFTGGWGLVLIPLGYAALWWKVMRYRVGRGDPACAARVYATFNVLGKWPELLGHVGYWWQRCSGRRAKLIEYKSAAPAGGEGRGPGVVST